MAQLSLTDFVDIVSKSGHPKVTAILQVKTRPEYAPATDFYKGLREHIASTHRTGEAKRVPSTILARLTDPKKQQHYPLLIDGYNKWWGRKSMEWFNPPKEIYSGSGVDVSLNPELGLLIDGKRHIVKLYFKADALSKLRVELITGLMEHKMRARAGPGDSFAVLDVRKSRLFASTPRTASTMRLVNAELGYIANIWSGA